MLRNAVGPLSSVQTMQVSSFSNVLIKQVHCTLLVHDCTIIVLTDSDPHTFYYIIIFITVQQSKDYNAQV